MAPDIGTGKRPEEAEKPGFYCICRWPGTGGNWVLRGADVIGKLS